MLRSSESSQALCDISLIVLLRIDPALPINARRDAIRAAVEKHPLVIVCGETGSGKTTQLPQILLEMGRGSAGRIGHTQPRRIAARSVAARVADELGTKVGPGLVGRAGGADRAGHGVCVPVQVSGWGAAPPVPGQVTITWNRRGPGL